MRNVDLHKQPHNTIPPRNAALNSLVVNAQMAFRSRTLDILSASPMGGRSQPPNTRWSPADDKSDAGMKSSHLPVRGDRDLFPTDTLSDRDKGQGTQSVDSHRGGQRAEATAEATVRERLDRYDRALGLYSYDPPSRHQNGTHPLLPGCEQGHLMGNNSQGYTSTVFSTPPPVSPSWNEASPFRGSTNMNNNNTNNEASLLLSIEEDRDDVHTTQQAHVECPQPSGRNVFELVASGHRGRHLTSLAGGSTSALDADASSSSTVFAGTGTHGKRREGAFGGSDDDAFSMQQASSVSPKDIRHRAEKKSEHNHHRLDNNAGGRHRAHHSPPSQATATNQGVDAASILLRSGMTLELLSRGVERDMATVFAADSTGGGVSGAAVGGGRRGGSRERDTVFPQDEPCNHPSFRPRPDTSAALPSTFPSYSTASLFEMDRLDTNNIRRLAHAAGLSHQKNNMTTNKKSSKAVKDNGSKQPANSNLSDPMREGRGSPSLSRVFTPHASIALADSILDSQSHARRLPKHSHSANSRRERNTRRCAENDAVDQSITDPMKFQHTTGDRGGRRIPTSTTSFSDDIVSPVSLDVEENDGSDVDEEDTYVRQGSTEKGSGGSAGRCASCLASPSSDLGSPNEYSKSNVSFSAAVAPGALRPVTTTIGVRALARHQPQQKGTREATPRGSSFTNRRIMANSAAAFSRYDPMLSSVDSPTTSVHASMLLHVPQVGTPMINVQLSELGGTTVHVKMPATAAEAARAGREVVEQYALDPEVVLEPLQQFFLSFVGASQHNGGDAVSSLSELHSGGGGGFLNSKHHSLALQRRGAAKKASLVPRCANLEPPHIRHERSRIERVNAPDGAAATADPTEDTTNTRSKKNSGDAASHSARSRSHTPTLSRGTEHIVARLRHDHGRHPPPSGPHGGHCNPSTCDDATATIGVIESQRAQLARRLSALNTDTFSLSLGGAAGNDGHADADGAIHSDRHEQLNTETDGDDAVTAPKPALARARSARDLSQPAHIRLYPSVPDDFTLERRRSSSALRRPSHTAAGPRQQNEKSPGRRFHTDAMARIERMTAAAHRREEQRIADELASIRSPRITRKGHRSHSRVSHHHTEVPPPAIAIESTPLSPPAAPPADSSSAVQPPGDTQPLEHEPHREEKKGNLTTQNTCAPATSRSHFFDAAATGLRLMRSRETTQARLQQMRDYRDSIDPTTGNRLFQPSIIRR